MVFVRRLTPENFRGLSRFDVQAIAAWGDIHGIQVRSADEGGHFITSIDIRIPPDRFWPDAGPGMTENVDDCWMVVYIRVTADGTPLERGSDGRFDVENSTVAARPIRFKCRPPGIILALLDEGEDKAAPPCWDEAAKTAAGLLRRIRGEPSSTELSPDWG